MASFNSPFLCLYIFKESDIFHSFPFKIKSSIILSWFLWRAANWIVLFYKITRKKYLLYFPNKSRFFLLNRVNQTTLSISCAKLFNHSHADRVTEIVCSTRWSENHAKLTRNHTLCEQKFVGLTFKYICKRIRNTSYTLLHISSSLHVEYTHIPFIS